METRLDGNAAAGALQEIFPFEITTVEATCARCGRINMVGALAVYMHGMGIIVRCPSCDTALIRMAKTRGRLWLDVRGVRVFQFSVES